MIKNLILLCSLVNSINIWANAPISTVSKIKGDVKAQLADGTQIIVTLSKEIPEGATIQTGNESFVMLKFIDQSNLTIGANSILKIASFNLQKPGIISLIQGQLRAQVIKASETKANTSSTQSKLFVTTNNAAMGIRGTDFQVNYSTEDATTSLLTFNGQVAFNKLKEEHLGKPQSALFLESVLEQKGKVMITPGLISLVTKNNNAPIEPVKIEALKLRELEKQEVPKEITKELRKELNARAEKEKKSDKVKEQEKVQETLQEKEKEKERTPEEKEKREKPERPKIK